MLAALVLDVFCIGANAPPLSLGVVTREHDRDRHLIVELKAPSVTITTDELGQLKKCGNVLFG